MKNDNLKLETWPIDRFIEYARNPRRNDAVVDRMVSSIKEFGFRVPILAKSDGEIVDGHLRVKAARKLEMTELPVVLADDLTDAQVKAFRLLANRSVQWAEWDDELLSIELGELQEIGFDVELTGFDDAELKKLLTPIDESKDINDVDIANLNADPVASPGDIWRLGRHRIMCGDSADIKSIERLLDGVEPELLVYDPPFDVEDCWSYAIPAAKALVFSDYKHVIQACSIANSYPVVYQFIWDGVTSWYTPNRPLARHKTAFFCAHDPYWDFDAAIYFDDKQRTAKTVSNTRGDCDYMPLANGGVHLQTVYQSPNTKTEGEHNHAKPTQWVRALLNGTGAVSALDMFCGSGTSIIAAPNRMTVFGMELLPTNVDLIIQRWQASTGDVAEKV